MILLALFACATSDKGHTGLLWIDDALTCPIEDTTFTALTSSLSCEASPNLEPIEVLNRTSLDALVTALPITGQLTDDNGDGFINSQDTADILTVTNDGTQNSLGLFSSDTFVNHWSSSDAEFNGVIHQPHGGTQLAVGLGELETAIGIFGTVLPFGKSDTCHLARWEIDGTLSWVHTQTPISCDGGYPAVLDINGDGQAEVLIEGTVVSAASGTLIQQSGSTGLGYGYATDLDGDGQREWLDGSTVRQSNGAVVCETGINEGIPASADLDGDGDGEFLINTEGGLSWYHHDCTLGGTWNHSTGLAQPLIADIDGDGGVELVIQTETELIAYNVDGSLIWTQALSTTNPMGASAMDVDGNDIADIVAVSENALLLLDGKTGNTRLSYVLDSTPMATPYALELNGEGAPELVVTLSTGLWILELENGGANTNNMTQWHQRSYAAGMQGNGWLIPSQSPSNFATQNSFNSTASSPLERNFAEIKPTLIDTCIDDCELGVITYTVEIKNTGASDIPEGVTISVLSQSGDLLHSYTTEDELKSNYSVQLGLRVIREEIPEDGVILSVDNTEQVTECNEDDNAITLTSNPCNP